MATTILTADLYENVLTERGGDYSAKPRITGSYYTADAAADIVKERTEFRPETIEVITTLVGQKNIEAIAAGKSVITDLGQLMLTLSGTFEGESPTFDSDIHKIGVSFTPSQALLAAIKDITFNLQKATVGPVINSVTDSATGSVNTKLTPGKPAVITGVNLIVGGDDSSVGVYLTRDEDGATPIPVPLIVENTISKIIVSLPDLEAGEYYLSVTTQIGSSYQKLKTSRTYQFPILLSVVGDSDDGEEEVL